MSDAEKKVAVGACEEISEKNGWTTFAINVGTQYPVRLQTKLPAIIEAGRAVGGEVATWTYKETQGNENPNRPGTHYMNRYLDSVEAGAHAAVAAPASGSAPAPAQRPTEAHHEPIAIADKERAITRMACIRSAASIYSGVGFEREASEDVALEVMKAAKRFEAWVYRDIDPVPSSSGAATPQPSLPDPSDPDDIPFAWIDNYRID